MFPVYIKKIPLAYNHRVPLLNQRIFVSFYEVKSIFSKIPLPIKLEICRFIFTEFLELLKQKG